MKKLIIVICIVIFTLGAGFPQSITVISPNGGLYSSCINDISSRFELSRRAQKAQPPRESEATHSSSQRHCYYRSTASPMAAHQVQHESNAAPRELSSFSSRRDRLLSITSSFLVLEFRNEFRNAREDPHHTFATDEQSIQHLAFAI